MPPWLSRVLVSSATAGRRAQLQRAALASLAVCSMRGEAAAESASQPLDMRAHVITTCGFDASASLDFGAYDPSSSVIKAVAAPLSVSCTAGARFWIGLGTGLNSSSAQTRRMASGSSTLRYGLYSDACTTPWTDAQSPQNTFVAAPARSIDVTGCIDPNQTVPSGSYADTVVMTIHY